MNDNKKNYWEECLNNSYVKYAFKKIVINRILDDGYYYMVAFYSTKYKNRKSIKKLLKKKKSAVANLFCEDYPIKEAEYNEELAKKIVKKNLKKLDNELKDTEPEKLDNDSLFYLIYYCYRFYKRKKDCQNAIVELIEILNKIYGKSLNQSGSYLKLELYSSQKYDENKKEDIQDNKSNHDKSAIIDQAIIYDANKVEIREINSIDSYIYQIRELLNKTYDKENKYNLFFRGHERLDFELLPSLFRSKELYVEEKKLYKELQVRFPNELSTEQNHIDILSKMQHYGLPTRLLDITHNYLVALYFAVQDFEHFADDFLGEVIVFCVKREEIKYTSSDTVAILSSLPLFNYSEQCNMYKLAHNEREKIHVKEKIIKKFNTKKDIKRLVHEINQERSGFENKIEPKDLLLNIFIKTAQNSKRIQNQEGSFILCGLDDYIYSERQFRENKDYIYKGLNIYRLKSNFNENRNDGKKIVYIIDNRREIRKDLDKMGINQAYLFPEINSVAKYIKDNINII